MVTNTVLYTEHTQSSSSAVLKKEIILCFVADMVNRIPRSDLGYVFFLCQMSFLFKQLPGCSMFCAMTSLEA